MSEHHTNASILQSYPNHFAELSEPSDEELRGLLSTVDSFLAANNIDPDTVVFAGYDPSRVKTDEDKIDHDDELPGHFFGTRRSMDPPSTFKDDLQSGDIDPGERWMANPLQYASQGALGIYNKEALAKAANASGGRLETDDDFGTSLYFLPTSAVEQARVATLYFRAQQ